MHSQYLGKLRKGASVSAERSDLLQPPLGRFDTFTPNIPDIVADGQAAMPGWLPERSGMRRFAAPDDRSMRSGFTYFGPGVSGTTSYWTKEVWCVIEGSAELTVLDLETGATDVRTVRARDGVYLAEALQLTVRTGDEGLFIFYCAVPASSRDSHWVAALRPEDIADARKRLGFEPPAAE